MLIHVLVRRHQQPVFCVMLESTLALSKLSRPDFSIPHIIYHHGSDLPKYHSQRRTFYRKLLQLTVVCRL